MGMSCLTVLKLKLPCDFSLLHRVLPELRSKSLPKGQGCMVVMGQGASPGRLLEAARACVHPADQCRLYLDPGVQVTATS